MTEVDEKQHFFFRKKVIRPSKYFFRVKFEFDSKLDNFTDAIAKEFIQKAVQTLFGQEGRKWNIDMLDFETQEKTAILAIDHSAFVPIRAALTMFSGVDDYRGRITILSSSPHLMSLANDSRDM
eukprot:TRINITY_DN21952_c0_g1_i2.p1 TRINITY_DN21952_c0_g1~~TRINITY_DN21952_c0_g1_i2.p1  ORF type:complete len:124 (-),score=5.22 TRINITY_DN21952_c0_g1_i2:22-393(-)